MEGGFAIARGVDIATASQYIEPIDGELVVVAPTAHATAESVPHSVAHWQGILFIAFVPAKGEGLAFYHPLRLELLGNPS